MAPTMLENKRAVERLFGGLYAGNSALFDELYWADSITEWPQFGERIMGPTNRRKVFDNLPVKPNFHLRRIFGEGDVWVVEALVDYGEHESFVVTVFEFRRGKIARETGYWSDPKEGGAPWKAKWVEALEPVQRVPEPEELESDE
jgi:hypothetical protein